MGEKPNAQDEAAAREAGSGMATERGQTPREAGSGMATGRVATASEVASGKATGRMAGLAGGGDEATHTVMPGDVTGDGSPDRSVPHLDAGSKESASLADVAADGSERKTSAQDDWHQQGRMGGGGGTGAGGAGLAIGDQGAVEEKQHRPPKG